MVGFVLIVVIVVIGLLVFLLFGFRQPDVEESDIANNILSSILRTSSSCAIKSEPNFDDMRDLFKSCYNQRRCGNSQELACDVLEDTLEEMLDEIMILEPILTAYQFNFDHENPEGVESQFKLIKGECNGTVYGSEPVPIRIASEEFLIINLRICVDSSL